MTCAAFNAGDLITLQRPVGATLPCDKTHLLSVQRVPLFARCGP